MRNLDLTFLNTFPAFVRLQIQHVKEVSQILTSSTITFFSKLQNFRKYFRNLHLFRKYFRNLHLFRKYFRNLTNFSKMFEKNVNFESIFENFVISKKVQW